MPELHSALRRVLSDERESLNSRFALRQRSGQKIDAQAFLQHLAERIGPTAASIDAVLPERTRAAVSALYDASLDLFAAAQLGPEAKSPWGELVWSDLLPSVPTRLLAMHTQAVVGCLANAVVQVGSQRGARPDEWLQIMQRVAPRCGTLGELLDAGKVAAWQAGMAQYRRAALEAAARLSAEPACLALSVEPCNEEAVAALLKRLQRDKWLRASDALQTPSGAKQIRSVATAGAFVGFGGLFHRPPLVWSEEGRLLTSDNGVAWELFADAYGAWFCRIGPHPAPAAKRCAVSVDQRGTIRWGKLSFEAPHLAQATGVACDGETLAVTTATSHHVFLWSRTGQAA